MKNRQKPDHAIGKEGEWRRDGTIEQQQQPFPSTLPKNDLHTIKCQKTYLGVYKFTKSTTKFLVLASLLFDGIFVNFVNVLFTRFFTGCCSCII